MESLIHKQKNRWMPAGVMFAGLLLILTGGCSQYSDSRNPPPVQKGMVSLDHLDHTHADPFVLSGEWSFFPNHFIISEQSSTKKAPEISSLSVEQQTVSTVDLLRFENFHGTFHIKIKGVPGHEQFAILVKSMAGAYRVFIADHNGTILKKVNIGIPARSVKNEKPYYRPSLIPLPDNRELHLYIEFSNYNNLQGGFIDPPVLGKKAILKRQLELNFYIDFLITGVLFAMSIYHLILFFLRTEDRINLYFGLFSLLVSVRIILVDHYIQIIYPESYFLHSIMLRLEHITFFGGAPLFLLFLSQIFTSEFRNLFTKSIYVVSLIAVLSSLLMPQIVFTSIMAPYQLMALPAILFIIFSISRDILKRPMDPGLLLTALGFLVISTAAINDILYYWNLLETGPGFQYGLFLFISIQSVVIARDNILALKRSLKMSKNLTRETEQKTREIRDAMSQVQKRDREYQKEMEVASNIQRNLIPEVPVEYSHIKLDAFYQSRELVGGDYYDFFKLKDNRIAVVLVDASGKGVPAALLTSMARISFADAVMRKTSVTRILEEVNADILRSKQTQDILTGILFVMDQSGRFRIGNASHRLPLLYRSRTRTVSEVDCPSGILLGAIENEYQTYGEKQYRMEKGDRLVLFTDGFVEQPSQTGEPFGIDRFKKNLRDLGAKNSQEIRQGLVKAWSRHKQEAPMTDDTTLIVLSFD